jgi:hypothetical protein
MTKGSYLYTASNITLSTQPNPAVRNITLPQAISPLTLACSKTYAGSDKEVVIGDYDESDKNDTSDIDGKREEENPSNTNTGTKPAISNKGVIPHITPIIPITLHSSKEELTNDVDPPKVIRVIQVITTNL